VAVLQMFAELRASGTTFDAHLDEFAATFGAYASSQISIRVTDVADIPRMTAALRNDPPAELAGMRVERVDDFSAGFESFPATDLLRLALDGARVVVRPSGTEPK